MGRAPSVEQPSDSSSVLVEDQIGASYGHVRNVSVNMDAILLVAGNYPAIIAADANITATIGAAVTTINNEFITTFQGYMTSAQAAQAAAAISASAAATSSTSASGSATAAAASAATATTKAAQAVTSAAEAALSAATIGDNLAISEGYKDDAENAAIAAGNSANAASISAASIEGDAASAAVSAATATSSKNTAVSAAADADADRIAAQAAATAALASQSAAATSATGAAGSATAAATSKNQAQTSATNAASSETNAATSAATAVGAKTSAESARDTAVTANVAAGLAKTAAETARDAALASKVAAETAETNAETAETNAETAQAAAAGSATSAATSATTATTQAGIATTKADEAADSAADAAQSAAEAAAAAGGDFLPRAGGTLTGALTLIAGAAYGAGWNGSNKAVTEDQVYDKILALEATIPAATLSDTAYGAGWNADTTHSPSKNAVYDEMELRFPKAGGTITGNVTISLANAALTLNPTSGSTVLDLRGTASTNDGLRLQGIGTGAYYQTETHSFRNRAGSTVFASLNSVGLAVTGTLSATGAITQNGTAVSLAGHGHVIADITNLQTSLDAKLDDSQAGTFGLTLLSATNVAAAKASLAYTKADIGLSNVDNTTDLLKPISTATQAELDLKLAITTAASTYMPLAGGTFVGDIIVPIEAYGSGWDGSNEAPTKNAIYDEIEALKGLVVGAMTYKGTWNATTNSPAIPAAASGNKGWFYKVATAGTTSISGIAEWAIGDWIVSNGSSWDKIDNTEAVSSVAGLTGTITGAGLKTAMTFVKGDVGLGNADNTSDANKPVSTAQQTALDLKANAASPSLSGTVTVTGANILVNTDKLLIQHSTNGYIRTQVGGGTLYLGAGGSNLLGITATSLNSDLPLALDTGGNQIRIKAAGTIPTVLHRKDSATYYILLTDANAAINETWNTLRPFSINLTTGLLSSANGQSFGGGTAVADTLSVTGTGTATGRINIVRGGLAASSIFDDGNLHIYTPTAMWFDAPAFAWGPAAGGGGWMTLSSTTLTMNGIINATTLQIAGVSVATSLAAKADDLTTIGTQSTNKTAATADNNTHIVFSGASRTLTLNSTPSAGTSFTGRFTTAWTVSCTSLSKNGAATVSGGSIAAGKLVSFLHEGSGVWVATGDIT